MGMVSQFRQRARAKRAIRFRESFRLDPTTRILDLGSGTGDHIHELLEGTEVCAANIYAADVNRKVLTIARRTYRFGVVQLPECASLPFRDESFDIVFCSSAIEHVTGPKGEIATLQSSSDFRATAMATQTRLADEIRRVGKGYFVQTPHRSFPIESHTWLPFVGYLPRPIQLRMLKVTNTIWVKKTQPDWHLLGMADMKRLFPDARIVRERAFGFTKSIMAIRNEPA